MTEKTATDYMHIALSLAEKAKQEGEIPVGALIVYQNQIIAQTYNLKEASKDPTAHAEILALRQAAKILGDWRLVDCTLYVTLEPCCMCAGAMVNAHLPRLVFGAHDLSFGGCGGAFDLLDGALGFQTLAVGGILEHECHVLLQEHFKSCRIHSQKSE